MVVKNEKDTIKHHSMAYSRYKQAHLQSGTTASASSNFIKMHFLEPSMTFMGVRTIQSQICRI